ncbi:MAG: sulfite reductase subunit gamma [Gallionellales bacterium GWA2_60_18]|nr:MAG: sulfite reductase subunit gamma [Gallionellales bacterium GWA2_60_18]
MEQTGDTLPTQDAEGYLVEPGEWNESVALELAKRMGLSLEEDHWDVIRFMRAYYDDRQIAVDARHVIKHLAQRYGSEARNRLFELFPYGYVAQACKIAGMKRPRGWSTG